MRPSALLVLVLLVPASAALVPSAPAIVAAGDVTITHGAGTCHAFAVATIEGSRVASEGFGLVDFQTPCYLLAAFAFANGQGHEFGAGSCRILPDRAGECWYDLGSGKEPGHGYPITSMRIGPDGEFVFRFEGEFTAAGLLARTP